MIFDSIEMKKLIQNFEGQPDALVPNIIYLGRSENMAVERDYLENLIILATKSKQKDWIHRLLKEEADQHIGAWFEMMLYGWLSDLGHVDVEPELEGNYPDFSLVVEGQKIVVEAKACVTNNALVKRDLLNSEVLRMLTQIEKPFTIFIKESTIKTIPNFIDFKNEVADWLDRSPDKPFLFRDPKGNEIRLESNKNDSLERVHCFGPINVGWLDPEILKDPLHKKAGQHREIRKANYPYVIAIMLNSPQLFITQAVDAWFGKEQWILDPGCTKIVESRFDRSGLHFRGSEIYHRSVSGTLVFEPRWEENRQRRFLQAHYIQNPYANVRLSPDLFPAKSKFIVINQDDSDISMGWQ
jgi:hypothetical protein